MISRAKALEFLNQQISNKNIIKHLLATEACLRQLGNRLGADKEELERWAMVGLLHDGDYVESVPQEKQGILVTENLRGQGYEIPSDVASAMAAHNPATGVIPKSLLDWSLFCVDSLTGLIVAAALVHPDKKLAGVTVETVLKRFKEPSFARGTRREDIKKCEEKLGVKLDNFCSICLLAMQGIAEELGL